MNQIGGIILSANFTFNGYGHEYLNSSLWRANFEATITNGVWYPEGGYAPREIDEGATVGISAVVPTGYAFSHWEYYGTPVTFLPNYTTANATFIMPSGNVDIRAVYTETVSPGPEEPIIPPVPPVAQPFTVTVEHGSGSGSFYPGVRVDISATPTASERFTGWEVIAPTTGVTLTDATNPTTYFTMPDSNVTVRANVEDIVVTTPPTPEAPIRINDRVRVNQGVRTWATGQGMPTWVHGRTYPVIQIRTRNGGTELLLGDGINSWIRVGDVTRVESGDETTPRPIRVNDRVRVNQGVRTWATGEGMPSWVHGRTYPAIETRIRNGGTELLLGDGINSWIRVGDVALVEGGATSSTGTIRVNDRVRVNQGVRTWATGEGVPSWVHGRTYTVIETRTRNGVRQLLLGNGINSWIRETNVTRA